MALYLGFDLSTRGLTALAIEAGVGGDRRDVVFERALDFDAELPRYGTSHGVLPSDDPLIRESSPLMWAEALDRLMAEVARSGLDLSRLRAVSGAAQQHGSVYLNPTAAATLARLDPAHPLAGQLGGAFSRKQSPIWLDASTARQCAQITEALGGPAAVARLTGSRAFERCTGPQIRKFHDHDPASYKRTATIHLISSYAASLLAGTRAPIEPGDGAGMCLMDLAAKTWSPAALKATAPDLAKKLPKLGESWTVVGPLARYWRERYRLPAASVVAWSGDNPCRMIGVGLTAEGALAVSLGTSDTLFGPMKEPRTDPSLGGSVFGSPTGEYLGLVCFANGALARDHVRGDYGLDWPAFSHVLQETPPGNGGGLMIPWFAPEITPNVLAPKIHPWGLDPSDARANVRAVVEGQMMALANHSAWMGVKVREIRATGGAATNREILQVMADVFGADVVVVGAGGGGRDTAALGAALRAFHADELARGGGHAMPWEEVVAGFTEPWPSSTVHPVPAHTAIYDDMRRVYAACEAFALGMGPDPTQRVAEFGRGLGARS